MPKTEIVGKLDLTKEDAYILEQALSRSEIVIATMASMGGKDASYYKSQHSSTKGMLNKVRKIIKTIG